MKYLTARGRCMRLDVTYGAHDLCKLLQLANCQGLQQLNAAKRLDQGFAVTLTGRHNCFEGVGIQLEQNACRSRAWCPGDVRRACWRRERSATAVCFMHEQSATTLYIHKSETCRFGARSRPPHVSNYPAHDKRQPATAYHLFWLLFLLLAVAQWQEPILQMLNWRGRQHYRNGAPSECPRCQQ